MSSEKATEVFKVFSERGLLAFPIFQEGLAGLKIDLDVALVNELFAKADTDMNGVISLPEFLRFAENFPTLVDCLYHRHRDADSERTYQKQEADAVASLEAATQHEQRCREDLEHVIKEASRFESTLFAQRQRTAELKDAEQRKRQDLEAMRLEVDARKTKMFDLKVSTKSLRTDAVQHRRNAASLEAKALLLSEDAAVQTSELDNATSRLKAIERMLAEQQQVVLSLTSASEALNAQATSAREEAATELQHAQRKEDVAEEQGAVVSTKDEDIRCSEKECYDSIADLKRAEAATMSEAQREHQEMTQLSQIRDKEISAKQAVDLAAQRVVAARQTIDAVHDTRHQYTTKRAVEHSEEMVLLKEEVELRRQRDTLVEQEQSLRQTFAAFSRDDSTVPQQHSSVSNVVHQKTYAPATPVTPVTRRPGRDIHSPSTVGGGRRSMCRLPSPVSSAHGSVVPVTTPVQAATVPLVQMPSRTRLSVGRPNHTVHGQMPRSPASHP